MGELAFLFSQKTMQCGDCGICFTVPNSFYTQKLHDKTTWHCPNGHPRQFTDSTEEQRKIKALEQQLMWARDSRDYAQKEAERNKRKAAGFKSVLTKTKKRIGNGICPCCNRQFQNLQRHMAHLHPEYKDTKQTRKKK